MSVLKAKRHLAKSEFEHTFSLFYIESERLINKVPKRRKKYVTENIAVINNSIYNDLMVIQKYLFAKKDNKKEIKKLRILSVLEKINFLEKAIMVYSNIMSMSFEQQCNWVSYLDKEVALLNGMLDEETPKSKFKATVLDWEKISRFEVLRNMVCLHRYTHGKAVRAVGKFETCTTPLLIGIIDDALFYLSKANSYIPQTKAEYEEREKYIDIVLQKLDEIQRPMLMYFSTMGYSNRVQREWSEMLRKEIKLVKGLQNSDKKRFSKLP